MEPVLDKIGQEIKEGCYIAYGHLLSRSAGLRIGKVLKVVVNMVEQGWRVRELTPEYKIHVWGIDQEWFTRPPRLLDKRSILNFPSRIVVLADLPANLKVMLKDITFDTKLVDCDFCEGKGYFPVANFKSCPICNGGGKIKPV